ncbi:MAG: alpha/beta fold hydrolase [Actinomycetota bacterium]|nr:alpha/beta fold hydrolase [Actinomycetota bacterium]
MTDGPLRPEGSSGSEGTATLPSGIEIAYCTFGPGSAEPLLLVMGLGGPSIWWHDELCADLVDAGFHVIRYDNRDVGWSTQVKEQWVHRRQVMRAFLGRPVPGAYTMADMADDAFGLLDHLGIASAHVTGVSMGGMIAQTMAIAHPERVRSLVSIMSSTGRRTVGWQHPRLLPMLLGRNVHSRDAYIRQSARVWDAIGSPGYPEDPEEKARRAGDTWDRGISPTGSLRQMLAVLTQPDRTRELRRLRMPVLVMHGTADKMVHPSGGRATAAAIPGAELELVPGMGHDLPLALHPLFVHGISRTAERAGGPPATPRPRPAPEARRAPRAGSR